MKQARLRPRIEERARALGFASLRVTTPALVPDQGARLGDWLDAGRHGEMEWMAETADRRRHPSALWPEARSILVLGWNYAPEDDPLATLPLKDRATISVYARRRDYHDVVKGRLKELAGFVAAQAGGDVKVLDLIAGRVGRQKQYCERPVKDPDKGIPDLDRCRRRRAAGFDRFVDHAHGCQSWPTIWPLVGSTNSSMRLPALSMV